jgi:methoxymalonate biosynthesis acyl carrier protein
VELIERIRGYIHKNLTVYDDDYVLGNDDLIFELGFVDSVFAIQLVGFLEEQIGVSVQDTDLNLDNFCSVNRIVEFVNTKQSRG